MARFIRNLSSRDGAMKARRPVRPRQSGHARQHFVDFLQVQFSGGRGGDGCIAFTQLFRNPTAGAGGGDGGHGGHVLLKATARQVDLSKVARHTTAKDGVRGRGANRHGAAAKHTCMWVCRQRQLPTANN